MQLIIPMSGLGQRFINAGYKIPKPLIKVDNKSIISHVVNMFPGIDSVIFICNKNHLSKKELYMQDKLLEAFPTAKIYGIDQHKKGPIYAVLQIINKVDLEIPTIVNYCDFNCLWEFGKFKNFVKNSNCDGCVATYTGFHPHMISNTNYAYVKLKDSLIIDIQEKKPFTKQPLNENASSGTYYFKTGKLMKKFFEKTIENNLSVKGEYYVSMSYKLMIDNNLNVNNFNIDYFMQWGTPQDLKEYKWYSNVFKRKLSFSNEGVIFSNLQIIIPAAGLGKRFLDAGYALSKPLIEVSNKPMLVQAINYLPSANYKKVIIKRNMKGLDALESTLRNNYPNIFIELLNSNTSGQASTCLEGIKDLDFDSPLLISACDNGVIYNVNKFKELFEDLSIDIVVWGCRGYPGAIKNPYMYAWIEEENNLVKNICVKKINKDTLNDPVVTGTFFFRKVSIFESITNDLIRKNLKVNNEYYIDSSINNAIQLGYKVVYFEIDYYLCWGTPNDLETYIYWQDCFDKWSNHEYKKNLDKDFLEEKV